jgi:hypothetical protein
MRFTKSMLRQQLVLMRWTAATIVRDPRTGRELSRLLRTLGRSTVDLRLPWLPFRLIDELSGVVGPGTRVFEYGGGGSTLWFLDRGASVVTVEHDPYWAAHLRELVQSPAWTLLERPANEGFDAYISSIDSIPDGTLDVVLVDGRERARCISAAGTKVRPGGLLIVDDANRERYAAAISETPWARRDVVGFAPAKPTLGYTAVLGKPEVDA